MSVYWAAFLGGILAVWAVDYLLWRRRPIIVGPIRAVVAGLLWINIAALFTWLVHELTRNALPGFTVRGLDGMILRGPAGANEAALQFLTAYMVEACLAVDNVLVMAAILRYFGVPDVLRHRVLMMGVPLAMISRAVVIVGGVGVLRALPVFSFVLAAWLVLSTLRMLVKREGWLDSRKHPIVWLLNRFFPIAETYDGPNLVTRVEGRSQLTRLVAVVLMVETADLVFALDSIPAVLAVSRDPWLLFTASVLAIFTVRALFFALEKLGPYIRSIKIGFALVLAYCLFLLIVVKFGKLQVPTFVSTSVIASIIAGGALLAALFTRPGELGARAEISPLGSDADRFAKLTLKQAQRLIVLVVGSTVTVLGLIMLPGPGPGLLVIPAGLAILAAEFAWARKLLQYYGQLAKKLGEKGQDTLIQVPRPWLIPAVVGGTLALGLAVLFFAGVKPQLVGTFVLGALIGQSIWGYGHVDRGRKFRALGKAIPRPPLWPIPATAAALALGVALGLALAPGPAWKVWAAAGPAMVGYAASAWWAVHLRRPKASAEQI